MTKLIFFLVALMLAIKSISSSEEIKIPTTQEEIDGAAEAMRGGGNFGGDMMLNKMQQAGMKSRNWGNMVRRWPNGTIPYVVDNSIGNLRNQIARAAAHIKYKTGGCIQFVPRTNQPDYVWMIYGNQGCIVENSHRCWSWIGKRGGPQQLHLGYRCDYDGIVIHEMLHAVGFAHEQNRRDRDNYLTIFWQNIQQNQRDNFRRVDDGRAYTAFDYNSIMLYGEDSFTAYKGYKTMEAKDKRIKIVDPWLKPEMTPSDVIEVKSFYGCG